MEFENKSNRINYTTTITKLNENAFINEDDFWTNWEAFRTFVSMVIEKHIVSKKKYKTIAIWGAGRCKDLDLTFFCKNFDEVNLFDIKTDDLNRGVEFQNLTPEHMDKIKIHESFDFVAVEEDFYFLLEEMLNTKESVTSILNLIRRQANRINNQNAVSCFKKQFDVSISLSVHSQLFVTSILLIDKYVNNYSKEELLLINDEIGYLYKVGVKIYNEFLYETIETGGLLYVGFDLIEFSAMRGTNKLLENFRTLLKKGEVLDHLQYFISQGGVMGSIDGYMDFLKNYWINRHEITPTNFTIWDYFSFQAYFFICFGIVK